MDLPLPGGLEPLYDVVCVGCQSRYQIRPSLLMRDGIMSGVTTCPHCGLFMRVELVAGVAFVEDWQKWLAKQPEG